MEKKILEKQVQTDCIKWLTARGWIVTKMGLNSQRGWPDLLALRNGQAVFIEVKRPGGGIEPRILEAVRAKQDYTVKYFERDLFGGKF